jgi:hypothetical protein
MAPVGERSHYQFICELQPTFAESLVFVPYCRSNSRWVEGAFPRQEELGALVPESRRVLGTRDVRRQTYELMALTAAIDSKPVVY